MKSDKIFLCIIAILSILLSILYGFAYPNLKIYYKRNIAGNIQYKFGPGTSINDNIPESFKSFMLKNNMPKLLEDLYRDLDDKSAHNVDSAIHTMLHVPDSKYYKYSKYFDRDAFDKDFRTEEEEELYNKIQSEVKQSIKQYKIPKNVIILPYVYYYKHNLRFANDNIKNYVKNKIFIDAGAYYGDSVLVMLDFNPSIIYSFDIADVNIEDYKKTMELNNIPKEKYQLYKIAVSDRKGESYITNSPTNPFEGLHKKSKEPKNTKIETIDIDSFLADKEGSVGFIKADVQGSMYDVLVGMEKTIKKHRPILLFEIADSPQEFFYTKPLLEKITKNLNYTIKITKYPAPRTLHGTDIWAYPKELDN